MSAFQLAGIGFSALMALWSLSRVARAVGRRLVHGFWTLLWAAATVAFVFPDGTTVVAQALGIKRGADLVLYGAVLAGSAGFWLISLKLREQSRQITLLTRELAIQSPRWPQEAREPGPRDDS